MRLGVSASRNPVIAGVILQARLAELVVANAAAYLAGVTLAEAFPAPRSARVLGLEREDEDLLVGPPDDIILRHGDRLLLYGDGGEIEGLVPGRPRSGASSSTSPDS